MSSAHPVLIHMRGVSKRYPCANSSLGRLRTILALLRGQRSPGGYVALQSIDLEVRKGESVGLVGVNGAGKSTLLKLIAGVSRPSAGVIERHGRVTALLELGAGFHPEYTGRQNVFLAASLMGLSDGEIRARLDSILAFADIGEHIDQPIKQYSSGMVVRLGFAVATCVAPDILITDEVLAVGDESFQRKCTVWMERFLAGGGTLLLCSHSMFHIEKLCRKALWVHDGVVRAYGESTHVTREYLAWHEAKLAAAPPEMRERIGDGRTHAVRSLVLHGADCRPADAFRTGGQLAVTGTVFAPDDRPPVVAIGLLKADGTPIYGLSSDMDGYVLERRGEQVFGFRLTFDDLELLPGRYVVRAHALDAEGYRLFDEVSVSFTVTGTTRELGLCRLDHRWSASGNDDES